MKALVISELTRIFSRKKTIILLFVIILFTLFDSLFIGFFEEAIYNSHGVSAPLNQLNFPVVLGKEIFFLLHFLIFPIFFIDSFSGELSDGSYRFIMTRPISRMHMLFSKWIGQTVLLFLSFLTIILISYAYGWFFIEPAKSTMFLHPSKQYGALESFIFILQFYSILFIISLCVLMIASSVATFINPILSYFVTVGVMVTTVYIGETFTFFLLPGEEALRIVHERDHAFLILTTMIITVGLLLNTFIWEKRDIYL